MVDPMGLKSEKEAHLKDFLAIIIKRKWVLIAFFVVVVVTMMVRAFSIQPIFQATCQVLIEREAPKVVKIEEVMALDARWGDEYYETQYELIRSNLIAQRVIKELNLAEHPEFSTELVHSTAKGDQLKKSEARLIHPYLSRLSINPVKNSRLVNINFESYDPELAARIANTHAKHYIEHSWERKFDTTQDAVQWLKQQIKGVRKKLEVSEEELQHYRKKSDLVSLDFGERHNIIIQKLHDLNNTLTHAKTTCIEKENLYDELNRISEDPVMIESIPAVLHNPLIQGLKLQQVNLEGEHSELSQKFGPEHPQMIRLRSQIKEIRGKITRETKKIAQSIETEFRVAQAKEKSLEKALVVQKKEALALNQKEIQYNLLKRNVEINSSIYESLLKRLNETTIAEDLEVTNISIVASAVAPKTPVKPNKSRSFMLAMVIGLMGGLGFVFFVEYLDRSVKSSEDIEEKLGMLSLGNVETLTSPHSEKLITLHDQKSIITEELRTVASNLLFSIPDRPNKVILVTSALPQEGKTFLSTNLSVVLAEMGKRVLLIDVDMRNPSVHSLFKIDKAPGLSDYLLDGDMPLVHIQETQANNVSVMSAGTSVPNPAELLMSQRMSSFIKKMRENEVFIILDAPPVMMLSDTLNLASLVDGVVMVVKSSVTPCATIQKSIQQLEQINAKLVGAVLNKHNISRESYYNRYYYRDYHYYLKGNKRERAKAV